MANPDLAKNPDYVAVRREVVTEAIRAYEKLLLSQDGSPEKTGEVIAVCIHIALLYTIADDHPKAEEAYRKAVEIVEGLTRARSPTRGTATTSARRTATSAWNSGTWARRPKVNHTFVGRARHFAAPPNWPRIIP